MRQSYPPYLDSPGQSASWYSSSHLRHHGLPPMPTPVNPLLFGLLLMEFALTLPSMTARLVIASQKDKVDRIKSLLWSLISSKKS